MKNWDYNERVQNLEQDIMLKAIDSEDFDNMTDEQWCKYLEEQTSHLIKKNAYQNQRLSNYKWLYKHYIELDRTAQSISTQLECSESSVYSYLKKHAISKKKIRSQKKIGGR